MEAITSDLLFKRGQDIGFERSVTVLVRWWAMRFKCAVLFDFYPVYV